MDSLVLCFLYVYCEASYSKISPYKIHLLHLSDIIHTTNKYRLEQFYNPTQKTEYM